MKKSLLTFIPALLILSSIFLLVSCKKDDPNYQLEGKWTGTHTPVGGGAATYLSLTFLSGNNLKVEGNNAASPDLGTGTYTLTGNNLTGTFTYTVGIGLIYNFVTTYNSTSNVLSGTIGINPSTTNSATFTLTKQ